MISHKKEISYQRRNKNGFHIIRGNIRSFLTVLLRERRKTEKKSLSIDLGNYLNFKTLSIKM